MLILRFIRTQFPHAYSQDFSGSGRVLHSLPPPAPGISRWFDLESLSDS
jgi:hypothetical protein